MNVTKRAAPALALATVALPALMLSSGSASAQSSGSANLSSYQSGYNGARYSTARPQTGSTRDANGNRLVVNGIIQAGASSYSEATGGVSSSVTGVGSGTGSGGAIGGSTAIGNNLNVVVQGNRNTVIVNSRQVNNGDVTAGTNLNGGPRNP